MKIENKTKEIINKSNSVCIVRDKNIKAKHSSELIVDMYNKICYIAIYGEGSQIVNYAIIDMDDIDKVYGYRFNFSKPAQKKEYKRVLTTDHQKLHHLIIGKPPAGLVTDHIDRDTSNNRKSNLRFISKSESAQNRAGVEGKTSQYKGVHYDVSRGKYKAEIGDNFIGRYKEEEEAAKAYNLAATKRFGEFAVLNEVE